MNGLRIYYLANCPIAVAVSVGDVLLRNGPTDFVIDGLWLLLSLYAFVEQGRYERRAVAR